MTFRPAAIEAAVVVRLELLVAPENRARFLEFCRRAFPLYESVGGTTMLLYEREGEPGRFDELACYASEEDRARSERALEQDPAQRRLIEEWRGLLAAPPRVVVTRRVRS